MKNMSTVELADKIGSVFKLAVIASKRATALAHGAPALTKNLDLKSKPTMLALEEIKEDKVILAGSSRKEEKKKKKA
jgi:DNA-directed RNA polymerase omega subunit